MTKEEAEIFADNMTYSQAVNYAFQGRCIPYRKATKAKLKRLLNMIRDLESLFHEEMVSKQQVVNAIENTDIVISSNEWDELMKSVNSVSSIDPKRVKGTWRKYSEIDMDKMETKSWYECTKCGFIAGKPYPYCVCGAKMED